MARTWATAAEIKAAKHYYQTDEVEIDDHKVKVSDAHPHDDGRWVAAALRKGGF